LNQLDEYEQSGCQENFRLINYGKQLTEATGQFEAIQLELEVFDEEEQACGFEIRDQYVAVEVRLQHILRNTQTASPSTPINLLTDVTSAISNPIVVKLSYFQLPTFDGNLEKWSTFYDTLSSTMDKNLSLMDTQRFHYLRSVLQGEATDCLNALSINNINYNEATSLLKETFKCPRHTAFTHCTGMIDYPKITKESPTK
jgi:hypothetical protein